MTLREMAIFVRVAVAWFCFWPIVTVVLYAIFGRCLAAKIACGLWLGPFAIAFAGYWLMLILTFLWDAAAGMVQWFMEPWRDA